MKSAQGIYLVPFCRQSEKVSEIKPPLVDTEMKQIDLIFIQYLCLNCWQYSSGHKIKSFSQVIFFFLQSQNKFPVQYV